MFYNMNLSYRLAQKNQVYLMQIFQKVNQIQRHYSNKITNMNIIPIEALQDNYMYLIVDQATKECAAVDPVEPLKVYNLKLTIFLI